MRAALLILQTNYKKEEGSASGGLLLMKEFMSPSNGSPLICEEDAFVLVLLLVLEAETGGSVFSRVKRLPCHPGRGGIYGGGRLVWGAPSEGFGRRGAAPRSAKMGMTAAQFQCRKTLT